MLSLPYRVKCAAITSLSGDPDVGKDKCLHHPDCAAIRTYPTEAISNNSTINRELCINCGTCTLQCPGGVFHAKLGAIEPDEKTVPVSLRQSDRAGRKDSVQCLRTEF